MDKTDITDFLKRELNPAHDLDRYKRIHLESFDKEKTFKQQFYKTIESCGEVLISEVKSAFRGGVAGATVGAAAGCIYASLSGSNVAQSTYEGALLFGYFGAVTDVIQVSIRGIRYNNQHLIEELKRIWK